MKKILLLGGSRFLLPVIKAAHDLGHFVITCDYLPQNIAHRFADKYRNVSIVDKDAVLKMAQEEKIDGVTSFACDPGVETAAYVAERMGLPGLPYESVCILQNKARFRAFLAEHGFTVPKAKGYTAVAEAVAEADIFQWPVIVKPVDSAGSKGVTRVDVRSRLAEAARHAIDFSKTKSFIIEEFIEKKGNSSDTDSFSIDGKLVFASFDNQYFDDNAVNPYTPAAYSWPSTLPIGVQAELRGELQRMISLLHLGTSLYNVETRQGVDGKAYIMEVSPRGGGNRLSEMLAYASGTDLITNTVRSIVGDRILGITGDPVYRGSWAEVILHAPKDGVFDSLWIAPELMPYVVERDLWVKPGEQVHAFTGANEAIGTLVLRFADQTQLPQTMRSLGRVERVIVR